MPQDELQDQPLDVAPSTTTIEDPRVMGAGGFAPPLGDMSADEFRRYACNLVNWIPDYFEHVERLPVLAQVEPGAFIASLPATPPEAGEPMEKILADVDRLVMPALTHWGIVIFGRSLPARVLLNVSAKWSGAVISTACKCGSCGRWP